jgi:hypothetical protein
VSFTSPIDLYHVVKQAWSADTVATPFDGANPCKNQCAVTALAVQQLFGGDIVNTRTKGGTHFYNKIHGSYWDLAADQFDEPIPYDNTPSSSDEAFDHATPDHLASLLTIIEKLR